MYNIPAMVHDNNAALPTTPSMDTHRPERPRIDQKGQAQEWWARYDRQRLARDIYMLLWTVGGVEEYVNPATDAVKYIQATGTYPIGTPPYTPAQIEEMAQFAVNYVDAMDRDSVITRFEYDDESPRRLEQQSQRGRLWGGGPVTDVQRSPVDSRRKNCRR